MIAPFFVALVGLGAPAAFGGDVDVGDQPAYTFREAPRNGVFVRTLEDLRGAPVLVEFWGPRCPTCVQSAVPQALELQETWGEDLHVVFVEVQGAGDLEAARFVLRQRWFGGRAQWTSEVPFWPGGTRLPAFVLLGNEGRVLLEGNPLTQSREIGRLVASEVRARREPPAGTPEPLRSAWGDLVRGRIGPASETLARVSRAAALDPAALARWDEGLTTLRRAIDGRFAHAAALLEAGHLVEFDQRLDALRAGALGETGTLARIEALALRAGAPEFGAEREADRRLARVLSRFFESGGAPERTEELQVFADSHAGTRAAARALDWAALGVPPVSAVGRR